MLTEAQGYIKGIIRGLLTLLLLAGLTACATLPEDQPGPSTYAIPPDAETISKMLQKIDRCGCGEDCSGHVVLNRGEEALRWRLVLADTARKSVDAQYYIWHGDASGMLLLDRLIQAAGRGIRRDSTTLNLHHG